MTLLLTTYVISQFILLSQFIILSHFIILSQLIILSSYAINLDIQSTAITQTHTTAISLYCTDVEDIACVLCKQRCNTNCDVSDLARCLAGEIEGIPPSIEEYFVIGLIHSLTSNKVCQGRRGVVERSVPFVGVSQLSVDWSVEFESVEWVSLISKSAPTVEIVFEQREPIVCPSSKAMAGTISLGNTPTRMARKDHSRNCGSGRRGEVLAEFKMKYEGTNDNAVTVDVAGLDVLRSERRMFPKDFSFTLDVALDHSCSETENRSLGELRLLTATLNIPSTVTLLVPHPNHAGCCALDETDINRAPLVAPHNVSQLLAAGGVACGSLSESQCRNVLKGRWFTLH